MKKRVAHAVLLFNVLGFMVAGFGELSKAQVSASRPGTSHPRTSAATHTAAQPAPGLTAASFLDKGLHNEALLSNFYQGVFEKIDFDRDDQLFAALIDSYLYGYSQKCEKTLAGQKRVELTHEVCDTWSPELVNARTQAVVRPAVCTSSHPEHDGWADPELFAARQAIKQNAPLDDWRTLLSAMNNPGAVMGKMMEGSASIAPDVVQVIVKNGCSSPALMRFQQNIRLFALNKDPIGLESAGHALEPERMTAIFKDTDYAKLMDDLVADQSATWTLSKYRRNSIGLDGVRMDSAGKPYEVHARYVADGYSGYYNREVRLDFTDGRPNCLYFSDLPQTCRTPNRKIAMAFLSGDYYAAPKTFVPPDPAKAVVDIFPESRLGVDIILSDSVATLPYSAWTTIHGVVAKDVPGNNFSNGAILAIPKGSPVMLMARNEEASAEIDLMQITLPNGTVMDCKRQRGIFSTRGSGGIPSLPKPGSDGTIHFKLPLGLKYEMLQTEFERQKRDYAASLGVNLPPPGRSKGQGKAVTDTEMPAALDDFRNRRIYSRSTLFVSPTQEMDLDTAKAGALLHAKSTTELDDPYASSHPDRLTLGKGTDIYFKVSAVADDVAPYVKITLTADHFVYHGLDIPLVAQPFVARVAAKEKAGNGERATAAQARNTTMRIPGISGVLGGAGGILGRSGVPLPGRQRQDKMANYENMTVISTKALIAVTLTEDSFVSAGKPGKPEELAQQTQ